MRIDSQKYISYIKSNTDPSGTYTVWQNLNNLSMCVFLTHSLKAEKKEAIHKSYQKRKLYRKAKRNCVEAIHLGKPYTLSGNTSVE